MPQPDIVVNTSPFGSRHSIDKEASSVPNIIEKIESTPPRAPRKKSRNAKKSIVLLVIGLVTAGVILVGLFLFFRFRSTLGSSTDQPQQGQPIPSPQEVTAEGANLSPTIFTNPLDSTRHFIAVGLVVLTFVLSASLIKTATKKSLEAIGRNPMAAKHVKQSLILVLLVLLLIISMGLGISYFLFYGNPPPTHTRIVAPTPPPSLPEGTQNNVFTTNCLTVSVPLKTNYPKLQLQDNRCTLSFTVIQPRGNFTLTYRPIPEHPFDQDPSVSMRRAYADKYIEFNLTHPRFARILAFKTNTEQTYFLRDNEDHHFELSFHGFQEGYESVVTPEIIYYLLDSIQLPQAPREDTLGVSGSKNNQ